MVSFRAQVLGWRNAHRNIKVAAMKTRRELLKLGAGAAAGVLLGGTLTACATKLDNKEDGSPWRCTRCGKLLRSHEDMSAKRCSRCFAKKLVRITEEELLSYL